LDHYRAAGQPVILSFWHSQIFCAAYFFRFQRIAVMTSRHFDGEYIGRIIRALGFHPVRGSSTRGGVQALRELYRRVTEGQDVGFAVDGPRGPAYRVKRGPLFLARRSGVPIVPFHIEPHRFWALNSWDGFRIPKPFTRALVKFGEPIQISKYEGIPQQLKKFQTEMDRLKRYAETFWLGRETGERPLRDRGRRRRQWEERD
jgi:lysophospholipid acyltransferase (LPLAT)-like uncharacterized protein